MQSFVLPLTSGFASQPGSAQSSCFIIYSCRPRVRVVGGVSPDCRYYVLLFFSWVRLARAVVLKEREGKALGRFASLIGNVLAVKPKSAVSQSGGSHVSPSRS